MEKFKYGLTCVLTKEQAEEIVPLLEELGRNKSNQYNWKTHERVLKLYVSYNYNTSTNDITFRNLKLIEREEDNYPHIETYNKHLILAIAAMREGEKPHIGEIMVMEKAGGWSYSPKNNGCLAVVNNVGKRDVSYKEVDCISGIILNPNAKELTEFYEIPKTDRSEETIWRKATKEEILSHFLPLKEEFTLPTNWHVIVTPENLDILSKWRFTNSRQKLKVGQIVGCIGGSSRDHNGAGQIKGEYYDFGQEITFKQFQQYVLKEQPIIMENKKQQMDTQSTTEKDYTGTIIKVNHNQYLIEKPKEGEEEGYVLVEQKSQTRYTGYDYERVQEYINTGEWKIVEETSKILGYKAPMDLFNGDVKAGTVYKIADAGYIAYPINNEKGNMTNSLPSEIVKQWEVVHEEEFKAGDYVTVLDTENVRHYDRNAVGHTFQLVENNIVNINHEERFTEGGYGGCQKYGVNYTKSDIRKATAQEIQAAQEIKIAGYKAEFIKGSEYVKFGCQEFHKKHVSVLKLILSSNINAELTIKGEKITIQTLDKILSRMK